MRGPPLYYFEIYIFGDDPKIFLKAPLAPIYTNFEWGSCAKKRDFMVKNFQKVLTSLFWPVFLTFASGAENFTKTVFLVIWESSENQVARPKKKEKLLKILDPPLSACMVVCVCTCFRTVTTMTGWMRGMYLVNSVVVSPSLPCSCCFTSSTLFSTVSWMWRGANDSCRLRYRSTTHLDACCTTPNFSYTQSRHTHSVRQTVAVVVA